VQTIQLTADHQMAHRYRFKDVLSAIIPLSAVNPNSGLGYTDERRWNGYGITEPRIIEWQRWSALSPTRWRGMIGRGSVLGQAAPPHSHRFRETGK